MAHSGAKMLDAPVSGSINTADADTLIFFVGGDPAALEQARPAMEKLNQKIVPVGANGQGIATKIAINLSLPIQLIALFEGVLLAERSGILRETALHAFLDSVLASPAMKYRALFILKAPDEVWFNVEMMLKDINLALDMGEELGVDLPSVRLSRDMLLKAIEMGYGEKDFAVLFEVLRYMSAQK